MQAWGGASCIVAGSSRMVASFWVHNTKKRSNYNSNSDNTSTNSYNNDSKVSSHTGMGQASLADPSASIVDVAVPAGSVVLFNSRLLHAARQNQHASRTRYSLLLGALLLLPSGCVVPCSLFCPRQAVTILQAWVCFVPFLHYPSKAMCCPSRDPPSHTKASENFRMKGLRRHPEAPDLP